MKLLDTSKGIAKASVESGSSILLWQDLWNDNILKLRFPELFSYAKDQHIFLSLVATLPNLANHFNLPLFQEAFVQFQQLEDWLAGWQPSNHNDIWSFIWGSSSFSTAKAYKSLIGHRRIDPLFKWIWKSKCQMKHKVFLAATQR